MSNSDGVQENRIAQTRDWSGQKSGHAYICTGIGTGLALALALALVPYGQGESAQLRYWLVLNRTQSDSEAVAAAAEDDVGHRWVTALRPLKAARHPDHPAGHLMPRAGTGKRDSPPILASLS